MEIKTNNLSQLIKNNVGYDEWIENIKSNLLNLEDELEILEISQIQNSSFGLIFKAVSKLYGNIILKFIPPYINRYENEKKSYLNLSSYYMCRSIVFYDHLDLIILEDSGERIQIDSKSINLLNNFFSIIFKSKE